MPGMSAIPYDGPLGALGALGAFGGAGAADAGAAGPGAAGPGALPTGGPTDGVVPFPLHMPSKILVINDGSPPDEVQS